MNSPEFKVSVVMPVYNAVKYLTVAVESAVHLPEVHEVILIEDCSPDGALAKCRELASTYSKVKLAQHPNGENRGAGASRNLGIQLAQSKYIAFLDADDYYLPNRFHECKRIFLSDDTVDGVYGATGFFYENEQRLDGTKLTTLQKTVAPRDLLYILVLSTYGGFTTDAITFKKSLLDRSGIFDTTLRLHQDTHLWLRMAFVGKLVPGNITSAVAIRRVHSENRISTRNAETRKMLMMKTYEWFRNQEKVDKRAFRLLFKRYVVYAAKGNKAGGLVRAAIEFGKNPQLISKVI